MGFASPIFKSPLVVAVGALLIAMVSIQFGASVAKELFPLLGAPGTAALRLLFAALILAVVRRPWRGSLTPRDALYVVLYGAALGSMNYLFYLALARIPLGIAVALEFTGPLLLAVVSSRRLSDGFWVLLAATGIVLIVPHAALTDGGARGGGTDGVGVVLALAAGGCWALYIVFGQRLSQRLPGGRASALGMAVAAVVVVPFGILDAGRGLAAAPTALALAFAVALCSSALPYTLEMVALKRLPTRTFGVLMSLEPAVAGLSGWAVLGERLTPRQWLATAAVMIASLGSSLSAGQSRRRQPGAAAGATPPPPAG